MIKTAKQLGVANKKLMELKEIKSNFQLENKNKDSAKYQLGLNSFTKLINELESEIAEYHQLSNSDLNIIKTTSIEDLPQLLIKCRLAKKMSQTDLAKKIGIDVQQIQRYETTDYESASWVRLVEVILALELNIRMEKVVVNQLSFEKTFQHPETISESSIKSAEEKIRNTHLLAI